MNKLIPFSKFNKNAAKNNFLSQASVVMNEENIPVGFVFGRDAFISFCTKIDEEFEKLVDDPKKAYDNPAGKLIDLIEERLEINPKFAKELKSSLGETNKEDWISLEEISRSLNV